MSATETRPLLGCIADDFTGATDLANMLVRGGMRTVQVIGVPAADAVLDAADAVVVALKSRTTPAAEAVSESLAALAWLRQRGCRQFFFKYCSTFDSTAAGNIGPVAEALQEALDCDFTLACPAFPETGRTLFRGHLFVQDLLLSESGMQHHPLTPMGDANLVRVLQAQSRGTVGLLRYDQVAKGPEAVRQAIAELRESGHRLAIADALSDADLHTLGAACAELPLVTGGSGIAQGLPENFRRAGLLQAHDAAALDLPAGGEAVLAGSASQATNGQVAAWLEAGRPALRLDPLALAQGDESIDAALAWARDQGQAVLIYATSPADEVKGIQRELGVARAGELVERALGLIARGLFDQGVRRLVVAGGETSGAVVQALGVRTLRIGAQIDPGVPATLGQVAGEPLALALKSGNFGSRDFFAKALRQLAGEQP
ncbi:3-oxo-tetronate kinase [Pseudomonas oryzihabitans]|uniref:3-oxo-tetronate kinase n=1 Tax=Pseudomonas oryzihabitans TaxID=47885 RepID=UPI00289536CC|nr:3-oxo-tetronate kinase [Pseudomonas oryzihabitans]MDT3720122.1 four-carbon acid sugar kinase family protein [Pseudomonas oryzihabitans]